MNFSQELVVFLIDTVQKISTKKNDSTKTTELKFINKLITNYFLFEQYKIQAKEDIKTSFIVDDTKKLQSEIPSVEDTLGSQAIDTWLHILDIYYVTDQFEACRAILDHIQNTNERVYEQRKLEAMANAINHLSVVQPSIPIE